MKQLQFILFLFFSIPLFSQPNSNWKARFSLEVGEFYNYGDMKIIQEKDLFGRAEGFEHRKAFLGFNFQFKKNKSVIELGMSFLSHLTLVTYENGRAGSGSTNSYAYVPIRYHYSLIDKPKFKASIGGGIGFGVPHIPVDALNGFKMTFSTVIDGKTIEVTTVKNETLINNIVGGIEPNVRIGFPFKNGHEITLQGRYIQGIGYPTRVDFEVSSNVFPPFTSSAQTNLSGPQVSISYSFRWHSMPK